MNSFPCTMSVTLWPTQTLVTLTAGLLFLAFVHSQDLNCADCSVLAPATEGGGESDTLTCPFAGSLCDYGQGCSSPGGPQWQQKTSWVEVSGAGKDFKAYSTLQSLVVHVQTPACLGFRFAQTLPSKLTVVVNGRCTFTAPDAQQETFALGQVDIAAGNLSIGFRAQNLAQGKTWVRLKDVTMQSGSCKNTQPTVRNVPSLGTATFPGFALLTTACIKALLTW